MFIERNGEPGERLTVKSILFVWIEVNLLVSVAFAGGEVLNGGNLAKCETCAIDAKTFPYYSTDYLDTFADPSNLFLAPPPFSEKPGRWLDEKTKLVAFFSRELLPFRDQFLAYLGTAPFEYSTLKVSNIKPLRTWLQSDVPLNEIVKRAYLFTYQGIPRDPSDGGCKTLQTFWGDVTTCLLVSVQAIIRHINKTSVIYEYNTELISQLREYSASQYSYLLVHEWLWDYSSDPVKVRKANNLIHQAIGGKLTPEAFVDNWQKLGLPTAPIF